MNIADIENSNQILDVTNLLGEWVNVNCRTDFIYELRVFYEDKQLKLNILSANSERDEDTSTLNAKAFFTDESLHASGFCAYQECRDLVIAANEKHGVLVIQAYRQLASGSSRKNQLTREFYRRKSRAYPVVKNRDVRTNFRENRAHQNSHFLNGFEKLSGDWRNTHLDTEGVNTFSIHKFGSGWRMQTYSCNDAYEWSFTALTPYFFDREEFGFVAHACSENVRSLFSAYSNKGLIVMTAFHTVKQNNQTNNIFCREFYSKECAVSQSILAVAG